MRMRSIVLLVCGATAGTLLWSPGVASAAPALPNSMAALGDSITQAYDVCCFYGNHPKHSWSTGGDSTDVVTSHYERILAANPSISGRARNDAVSGAKMSAGPTQASQAVSQGAQYVTILLGANDVCTSSVATMTSTTVFKSEFQQTMSTLEAGLPTGSHIFVSSIPNVYRLWQILHTNLLAETTWTAAGICQSMLSLFNTSANRQAVYDREVAFNSILGQVCAQYANCRFDDGAVFNYQFTRSDVSTLDYFHPSLNGQAVLASITWTASWWGTP
jgi:lysophospholipase L1-like esterase